MVTTFNNNQNNGVKYALKHTHQNVSNEYETRTTKYFKLYKVSYINK